MNKFLKLKNISKNYNSEKTIKVLRGLSQNFEKGKTYSIVGPSGSGKSTLLNLISLIDRPSSGSIMFDDNQINFNNTEENDVFRSKKIGIVYQQNNLLSDFTALENVAIPLIIRNNSYNFSIKKAENFLKKVNLENRLNHFPSELSGGEQQRVAIARSLIAETKIILADEPTGNLDYKNSQEVFSYFLKLKQKNKIILIATHNRELAKKADYTLSLSNGNIKRIND